MPKSLFPTVAPSLSSPSPQVVVLISHLRKPDKTSHLAQVVNKVIAGYGAEARMRVIDTALSEALSVARELEQSNGVDVFICASATAGYLRKRLSRPVVSMRVGGPDLLRTLDQARVISTDVAILSYRKINEDLAQMGPLFTVQIRQESYTTLEEARRIVQRLACDGYKVMIGSSTAVELAEEEGMTGILSLTTEAVRKAFDDALAICRSQKIEVAKSQRLNAVLQHLTDGVIAVDSKGDVQSINPSMLRLLDIPLEWARGRSISTIAPGLDIADVLRTGISEENRVILIGNQFTDGKLRGKLNSDRGDQTNNRATDSGPNQSANQSANQSGNQSGNQSTNQRTSRTVIASIMPIHEDGVLTGAVLTCQEMTAVQRADRRIRSVTRPSQFTARYQLEQINGDCPKIREVVRLAQRYASTDSTILVTGESGTGKELLAQGIHNASSRHRGPFVPINCAGFPETLIESELFGYEEGAFTGSRKGGKPGLFEAAHTGTVFLDEIGDMPVFLQTRLLRVLQEREVLRLGAVEPTPIDIRIVAATHCDLRQRIEEGRFREDLFYRLNILRIEVPSLRERKADIPVIARRILEQIIARTGRAVQSDHLLNALSPYLEKYHWPGNIRELENIIERAVLSVGDIAAPHDVDQRWLRSLVPEFFEISSRERQDRVELVSPGQGPDLRAMGKAAEISHIKQVLDACGGNLEKAARELGISRSTLWRRLRSGRAVVGA
ncbi:propionate catabolism operon regulatory protein PrpR [Glaciimonas immobilis]|uniref:Propionate catabolism operon transcriptional regulator n=1 Tax=Glaciimonas immobilis TaxID=728004 RepID=A0A840RRA4_9BURK|nr:propionate catabolism operon regulatory protein PrpR [Glaciimonas immobilis]KAF3997844.1 propionate catabolism operon regulatory protein PrpR [Glaciimonas immobilis]MBB5199518.1 propionate catabolism operon transcriptional regulator [Glaciimonas immobilis]